MAARGKRVTSAAAVGLATMLGVWLVAAPTATAEARHPPGFEPSLHVGVGGFRRDLTLPTGPVEEPLGRRGWAPGRRRPSVGAHLVLAYRFGPLFDAGLHVFHQWLNVEELEAGGSATATSPGAGVLVRLHPLAVLWPRLPVDLSVGAGFDFIVYARQTSENRAEPETPESLDSATGVSLPVVLGLDVLLGDLALGVLGIWSPWWRMEECRAVGTGLPDCRRETSGWEQYFFVGLGARVHLEFVR